VTSLYREPDRHEELTWGALEFHDVFKIYRSGPAETVALRGLNLRIEAGEIVAVFGPSGSGKSTMLRLAAGLEQASAGDVRAFGESLGRTDSNGLAAYRARKIAIIFQGANLWPQLSARENVALGLRVAGLHADVTQALAAFGVDHVADRRAAVLSGGEQQRVAIAAAAAREAPLVLADEPTGELDEANESLVLEALAYLRAKHGTSVVIVTHSDQVARIADRVVVMRDGRIA